MKRLLTLITLLILTACTAAELPTPSPSPSSTAIITPSLTPTPTATSTPSNTPLPTNTPTIQPIPSDCDAGVVIFSAHAVSESKKPLDGLYVACADGTFLQQVLSVESMKLSEITYVSLAFALSPHGDQVAISTSDFRIDYTEDRHGEVIILDLTNYRLQKIYEADYFMHELIWSPDGEYLLYFTVSDSYTEIEVLHIDTSTTSRITDSGLLPIESLWGYHLHDLDWLSDGEQIYYSADTVERTESGGAIYGYSWQLIDISCDSQTHLCKPVDSYDLEWIPDLSYALSWSQDGSTIISNQYYLTDQGDTLSIPIIELRSLDGTVLREIRLENYNTPSGYGRVRDAVLSPDGKRIAFIANISEDNSTRLGKVLILSLEDMTVTNLTEGPMFDDVMPGEVYWLP